ncbi:hypothetical protein OSC27_05055 [Microbacterium sp. STN6]|uniref:hypothetical protein n=1 Tax=Microbacterium sp. STN6 TaxID=2995588 RepID=UPI002260DDEE|nr:hypothetical protein [Microbacterium sp. STN6]MCX7521646.1 hypothetical protein [Microbacterium sp. STN6]
MPDAGPPRVVGARPVINGGMRENDNRTSVLELVATLFVTAILCGALLGVTVMCFILDGAALADPFSFADSSWSIQSLYLVPIASMVGGLTGLIAALGALVALVIFDHWMERSAGARAGIAGAGGLVATGLAAVLFVAGLASSSPTMIAIMAAFVALAGVLTAVLVRVRERHWRHTKH